MKRILRKSVKGFTLIELLVVIVLIGILAAIAIPQYFKVVEKGKVAEAMTWLGSLQGTQERYLAKNGFYCTGSYSGVCENAFDTDPGSMKYYDSGDITAGAVTTSPDWTITLSRRGNVSVYGQYGIIYDRGNQPPMSCTGGLNVGACTSDLLP